MTIRATDPSAIKRAYPHVSEVEDWRAQATIRLVWDRVHDLEERLQAAQATITDLVAGHNTNEATLSTISRDVREVLSVSQQPVAAVGAGAGVGTGGSSGGIDVGDGLILPGGGDDGAAAEGCAAAGATGHDTGGLLSAVRAGQLACGTCHEFPALLNPVPDVATRQANLEQMILRVIWHLRQAGFTAGRQRNPSGAISADKFCVEVDGVMRVYDMFIGVGITEAVPTGMREAGMPEMVDDAGIPDS